MTIDSADCRELARCIIEVIDHLTYLEQIAVLEIAKEHVIKSRATLCEEDDREQM